MADETEDYWFEPKRYGFGSRLPVRWQGWVVLALYVAVLAAASPLARRTRLGYLAIALVASALLIVICVNKTRGGWRWRWGKEED